VWRSVGRLLPRRGLPWRSPQSPVSPRARDRSTRGRTARAALVRRRPRPRDHPHQAYAAADAGRLTFAEPKTATSRRAIPIGAATIAALRAHRQRQAEERLSDLVFSNTLGGPINAGEMLRASFYPHLRRAGLSRIRFHDLRHTAATLMLSRGVHPKIVAERLGHSTPMLILSVYSHVTPTMQRAAADELDALLSSGG